jgi:hypothetical protein
MRGAGRRLGRLPSRCYTGSLRSNRFSGALAPTLLSLNVLLSFAQSFIQTTPISVQCAGDDVGLVKLAPSIATFSRT